ncbi:hypothetical protein FHR76_002131 [Rhizobium sp. RAS22]|nr:hypothetical protein [Rhizobium sp. RAS22]
MSKPTNSRKSRSTAASAETATGVLQDDVVTISTPSDPSGLRAPDGTHSTNTPASSGDAAGDASADLVKPQVNADHTGAIKATAANETPMPEVEASASGTIANASQGETEGAGANAGLDPADPVLGDILEAVILLGVENVLRYIELGQRVANIAALNGMDETTLVARVRLVEDAGGAKNFEAAMEQPASGAFRVKADREGFRRAGIAHSTSWRTFEAGELTVKQVAALVDDPAITVEYL